MGAQRNLNVRQVSVEKYEPGNGGFVGGSRRSAIGRAFRQLITTFETGSINEVLKDHGIDDDDAIDYNDRMKDGAIFLSVQDLLVSPR